MILLTDKGNVLNAKEPPIIGRGIVSVTLTKGDFDSNTLIDHLKLVVYPHLIENGDLESTLVESVSEAGRKYQTRPDLSVQP